MTDRRFCQLATFTVAAWVLLTFRVAAINL